MKQDLSARFPTQNQIRPLLFSNWATRGRKQASSLSQKTRSRTDPMGWLGFLDRFRSNGRTGNISELGCCVVPALRGDDVDIVASFGKLARLLEGRFRGTPAVG